MTITTAPAQRQLRLWPGVVIAALVWLTRIVVPLAGVDAGWQLPIKVLSGFVGFLAVLIWWLGFSRASRRERWVLVPLLVAAVAAPLAFGDSTMLVGVLWFAAPVLTLAVVAGVVAGRWFSERRRLLVMAVAIAIPCAASLALRVPGVSGDGSASFAWRWTETAEQRLLAQSDELPDAALRERMAAVEPATAAPSPDSPAGASTSAASSEPAALPVAPPAVRWSGFRGVDRSGVVRGARIETDWTASPPVALWRRPVGPGWASFSVRGDVIYTQEQRGDDEIVSAYRLTTGEPVWRHRDRARLNDPMGGPGPRATPTLAGERVYTFGSTGILNALSADTGSVLWSRDLVADLGIAIPTWGFSSSPLIIDDLVIVAAGGTLAAYAAEGGERRWVGPAGGDSYSSPHLAAIDGVDQVLLAASNGITSVEPATGKVFWAHPWNSRLPLLPIVQPTVQSDGTVLVGDSSSGVHLLSVNHKDSPALATEEGDAPWTVNERWASNRLKPYFNDFVVHRGHAYGFDGAILAAVDLTNGERKWKGGRYGQGQLVLLPDQDLLLVISEEGELALIKAEPDGLTEIARFPALSGKTWNHPVIVGDTLLLRNGEEMAAFRLKRL